MQRSNLGIRLEMSAVPVDARVEAQILEQRDGRVEARLPRRLRVTPIDAGRLGAIDIRSALLQTSLPCAAVADSGDDVARRVERRRAHLVQEEVADAEANAILRLT